MYIQRDYRIQRISQEVHKKISIILQRKIDDFRIGIATISGVKISKDLKSADIFVTFIGKDKKEEIDVAMLALQRASRFIRFLLAHAIRLRVAPILLFKYDYSFMEGVKICKLIAISKEKNVTK